MEPERSAVRAFLEPRRQGHLADVLADSLLAAGYAPLEWIQTLSSMPAATLSELLVAVGGDVAAAGERAVDRESAQPTPPPPPQRRAAAPALTPMAPQPQPEPEPAPELRPTPSSFPAPSSMALSPALRARVATAEASIEGRTHSAARPPGTGSSGLSPTERSQRARQEREERWKRTGADDAARTLAEMAMTRVKTLAVRLTEMDEAHGAERRARMMLEATVGSQLDMMHKQHQEIDALKTRVRQLEAEAGMGSPPSARMSLVPRTASVLRASSASSVAAPTLSPVPSSATRQLSQQPAYTSPVPHRSQQVSQQPAYASSPVPQQSQQQAAVIQRAPAVPPPPPPPPPPTPPRATPAVDVGQRREALQRQVSQRREHDAPSAKSVKFKDSELQNGKSMLRSSTQPTVSAVWPPSGQELLAGRSGVRSTHEDMAAADPELAGALAEFQACDVNQDGVLDAAELPQLFHWLDYDDDSITDEYVAECLGKYGDGSAITFEQFRKLWTDLIAHDIEATEQEQQAEAEEVGSMYQVTSEAGEDGVAVRYGPTPHVSSTPHWRVYPGTWVTVLCVDGDWAQLAAPSFEANKEGGVHSGWIQYHNRMVHVNGSTSPKGGGKKMQSLGARLRSPTRPRKGDPSEQQALAVKMRAAGPLLALGDGEPEPPTIQQLLPVHEWYGMSVGRDSVAKMMDGIEVYKYASTTKKRKKLYLTLSADMATLGWGNRKGAFDHSVPVRSIQGQLFGPRGANVRRYTKPLSSVTLGVDSWCVFSYFIQEPRFRRSLDFGAVRGERDAYHAFLAMEFIANDLAYGVRCGPVLWSVAQMRAMKNATRQGSSVSAQAIPTATIFPGTFLILLVITVVTFHVGGAAARGVLAGRAR